MAETTEHLMHCKSTYAQNVYERLHRDVTMIPRTQIIWFTGKHTSPAHRLKGFLPTWGSMGLITENIQNGVLAGCKNPKMAGALITRAQKAIIGAHLKIWKHRNKILFGGMVT